MQRRTKPALAVALCAAATLVRGARLRAQYPPQAPAYAWWAPVYGQLAPAQVVDVCGGQAGLTKWEEVSPTCATWTVTMLKCSQACNTKHHYEGFGACMESCGVKNPDCGVCAETPEISQEVSTYCEGTCQKWNECKCAETHFETPEEWMDCIVKCVYQCNPSLKLELDMGFEISWRDRACPPVFFACGGKASGKCTAMPKCPGPFDKNCVESTCAPPLGNGILECFYDDPFCGGREAFPNITNEAEPAGMLDLCTVPRDVGATCSGAPGFELWDKADGFPLCAEGLLCDEESHTCAVAPPVAAPGPAPGGAYAPGPAPGAAGSPTAGWLAPPAAPQWKEVRERMKNLTTGEAVPR